MKKEFGKLFLISTSAALCFSAQDGKDVTNEKKQIAMTKCSRDSAQKDKPSETEEMDEENDNYSYFIDDNGKTFSSYSYKAASETETESSGLDRKSAAQKSRESEENLVGK